MNARHRVANRLGLFIHGYQLDQGEEVSLTNEEAEPLLATGAIERAGAKKARR